MSSPMAYDRAFYETLHAGSAASAAVVLRQLRDLLLPDLPGSIVDLGCGDGSWLSVSREVLRPRRILGVDGGGVQEAGSLRIRPDEFLATDLETELNVLERKLPAFELAMCLEVAEHLPESSAKPLIETLCKLAPLVLFSAAVPSQGGTRHINEQWPSYWVPMFAAAGFQCIDNLRSAIWSVAEVEWWYRQNLLLFASEQALRRWQTLAGLLRPRAVPTDFDLVHPEFFRVAMARSADRRSPVGRLFIRLFRHLSDRYAS